MKTMLWACLGNKHQECRREFVDELGVLVECDCACHKEPAERFEKKVCSTCEEKKVVIYLPSGMFIPCPKCNFEQKELPDKILEDFFGASREDEGADVTAYDNLKELVKFTIKQITKSER